MARKSKAQLVKLLVLTVGVADVLGIYVAHHRLSQPVVDKVGDESFVLATSVSPNGDNGQKAVPAESARFALVKPKAATSKRPSPEELAQIDLPLPPMSADIGAAKHSSGKNSSHGLAASARERVNSDLPEMAGARRGMKNADLAARQVVVPAVRLRSNSIGLHEIERLVTYQAGLDLPEGHFAGHARSPGAKHSAAHAHSRLDSSSHHMANATAADAAYPKNQSFSAAFADGVGKAELPDVAYGQQAELPLVQPDSDKSSPNIAESAGVPLSARPEIGRPASDRATATPQPTLKDPFPGAETDTSLPKL